MIITRYPNINDPKYRLVLNPLASKLESVIRKANKINALSGPFDFTFLIGDSLTEGVNSIKDVSVSSPTYTVQGFNKLELNTAQQPNVGSKEQLFQENFSYLGTNGVKTFSNGLKVGFVSHEFASQPSSPASTTLFDDEIDILITSQWPSAIVSSKGVELSGSSILDAIIQTTRPSYVFSCGKVNGIHFESNPFKWKNSEKVTRFISLGQYKSKEKWFYAFNLTKPTNNDTTLGNLIQNPFENVQTVNNGDKERPNRVAEIAPVEGLKRPLVEGSAQEEGAADKKRKIVNPKDCFFCLSNPHVETHMVISIGSSCYMTIAKGPLTKPNKFRNKPISGHVLVIPVDHIPYISNPKAVATSSSFDESGSSQEVDIIKDLNKFGGALKKFFRERFEMGTCRFEINTKNSVHYHRQLFPFNLFASVKRFHSFLDSFTMRNNSSNNNSKDNGAALEKSQLQFHLVKNEETEKTDKLIKEVLDSSEEYICIELFIVNIDKKHEKKESKSQDTPNESGPNREQGKIAESYLFVSKVDSTKYIDLQFPRKVVANFLNMKDRVYWNKCRQTKEVEELEVDSFRNLYADYDFTL